MLRSMQQAEGIVTTDEQDKPLTREQFNRLRSYQYGGCALCGKVSHDLELDHDHKTLLIRGLLCNPCNLLLDEYEKKKRLYRHFEAYLEDPPMKALGLSITYKPAKRAS